MKIVYCLNSISHLGGIAVVTIVKANALAEITGNEVFVCVSDYRSNALSARLSEKVTLVDLDINYYADDWKSRWHVWKGILVKRRKHKRKLTQKLKEIDPDIVVSVGQCEKYMLPKIKGRWATVREIHYISDYRSYTASGFRERIYASLCEYYDLSWKIKGYDHIVLLTEEDRQRNWRKAENVSVIANPLTLQGPSPSAVKNKKVISIGRLEAEKNYSSLIQAFRYVVQKHSDWTLEIYGEGRLKRELQNLTEQLGLERNISLNAPVTAVADKYAEASCFALSSVYEGFSLVIVEAMACGLPVVAYDCPCGPRDIISDGVDGFLVAMGDEQTLADKINYLIEHPDKRIAKGKAALEKAQKYSVEKIVPIWMNLFEDLQKKKRKKEG